MATARERLHEMLDALPDELLADAEDAISALTEPPYRPLGEIPEDDEPVTAEDLEALREGREAYARGEFISNGELKRRLGW